MIDAATGIARILKQEGVEWISTFPVCKVNNALGREGVPMVMMSDDRRCSPLAGSITPRVCRSSHCRRSSMAGHQRDTAIWN